MVKYRATCHFIFKTMFLVYDNIALFYLIIFPVFDNTDFKTP